MSFSSTPGGRQFFHLTHIRTCTQFIGLMSGNSILSHPNAYLNITPIKIWNVLYTVQEIHTHTLFICDYLKVIDRINLICLLIAYYPPTSCQSHTSTHFLREFVSCCLHRFRDGGYYVVCVELVLIGTQKWFWGSRYLMACPLLMERQQKSLKNNFA